MISIVGIKFYFQQAISVLGPDLLKKDVSGQKHKKVNITNEFYIFKLV